MEANSSDTSKESSVRCKHSGEVQRDRWVEPGLGLSSSLPMGRARLWSLVAGSRDHRAGVRSLVEAVVTDTVEHGA